VLTRLREEFGDQVEIQWRAFELRPDPVPTLDSKGDYLRDTWARAVYPMAEQRGMVLRLPPVQPRSRQALEAAEFAREQGRFDAMNHALFRAFFEDGRDIGDPAVLREIAVGAGLDGDALDAALKEGRYTAKVLEDQRTAHELGVSGVPAMALFLPGNPEKTGRVLSGAQPYEVVRARVAELLAR
jgi:predicted DsbA family dithiol-disulfide isomerase